MSIIPVNKTVLIHAEEEKSPFQGREKKYAERGTILAIAEDCPKDVLFKVGDFVSFISHLAYRIEDKGKDEWFIPYDKITSVIRDE